MTSIDRRAFGALALAAGAAPKAFAAPAAADVVMPLQLVNGLPVVQATLNGKGPYRFLVGTGHPYASVDRRLVAEAGLQGPITPRAQFVTVSGAAAVKFFSARELVLGDAWTLPKTDLMAKDLSGQGIDGVFPFVARGLSSLNFDVPEMRFHPGRAPLPPEPTKVALVHRSGGRISPPMVRARLNGQEVSLLVNTGWRHTVSLGPDAVKRLGIWDSDPAARRGRITGQAREYETRTTHAETLEFAGASFARPPMRLTTPELAGVEFLEWDGEIGMELLRRFRILFAPDRQAAWFGTNSQLGDPYASGL